MDESSQYHYVLTTGRSSVELRKTAQKTLMKHVEKRLIYLYGDGQKPTIGGPYGFKGARGRILT